MDVRRAAKRDSWWSRRTGMERRLAVGVVLLVATSASLFATTALALSVLKVNVNRDTSPSLPSEICKSAVCQEKAQEILNSLDTTVEPCDNFYAFVCNSWLHTHPVPDDGARHSSYDLLRRQLSETLKDILDTTPYKTEKQNISDKMIIAYRSCINESVSDEADLQPLKDLMNRTGPFPWPMRHDDSSVPGWEDTFARVFSETGLSFVIALNVVHDLRNVTNYLISFDQPGFGIGRNQLLNGTTAHNNAITTAYKTYISESMRLVDPTLKRSEINDITENIVNFEIELAKRTRSPEERRIAERLYHRQKMTELKELFPELDWLGLMNRIFAKVNLVLTEEEDVVVTEPEYYLSTLKFLKGVNKSTIHNYFGWRLVKAFGPTASGRFRELQFAFARAVRGVQKSPPKWQRCVMDISALLDLAVGRIYIERTFSPRAKKDIEQLVADVKEAFSALMQHNDWMDDLTKQQAANKLEKQIAKIAYPEWLMNDTYLDNLYSLVGPVTPGTPYLTTSLNFRNNNIMKQLRKLHVKYNRSHEWTTGPAVVNAFYSPIANAISFPAAVLRSPYYSYGLPSTVNIGAIGVIIGHEITHGFDDVGGQFDSDGNLRNWWTPETRNKFHDRAKCFVDQYGSIYDDEAGMNLNGFNTQGENIADNGAIRASFRAHRIALAKQGKPDGVGLPGLEHVTSDQLFFISAARAWCTNSRREEMKLGVQYDTHSPSKYRVNIPMGNFERFSEAFNCREGSRMNISRRCVLW